MAPSAQRPRVLLIREWEQQMSSSGCCGRLEGDFLASEGVPCFPDRRRVMEAMGPLYRDLKAAYGDRVEVVVVDPRSLPTLLGLLVSDWMHHRVGIGAVLRTLARLSVTGVVVNGRLIARGSWPGLRRVVEALGPDVPLTDRGRALLREDPIGGAIAHGSVVSPSLAPVGPARSASTARSS